MFESFRMNEEEKEKVKKMFLFLILFIFVGCLAIFYNHLQAKNGLEPMKQNPRKKIVYTRLTKKKKDIKTEIPYLNVKIENVNTVNQEILDYVNPYLKDDRNGISYTFDVSDMILSLVIKVAYFNENEEAYSFAFQTYNVDLTNLKLLTEEDLLKKFQVTKEKVEEKIKEKFESFFEEEDKLDYFGGECDYRQFLFFRGFDSYLDDIHYYVKDNKLYVYKPFEVYSIYNEQHYYKEDDFLFLVS